MYQYIYIIYYRKRQVKYTTLPKKYQTKLHFFLRKFPLWQALPQWASSESASLRLLAPPVPWQLTEFRALLRPRHVDRDQSVKAPDILGSKCLKTPMVCGWKVLFIVSFSFVTCHEIESFTDIFVEKVLGWWSSVRFHIYAGMASLEVFFGLS